MAPNTVPLQAYVSDNVVRAFCIVGIIVATGLTAARLHVKITRQRRLQEDDYAHLVAVAFYYALCVIYLFDLKWLYAFTDYTSGKAAFSEELYHVYYMMMMYNFAVTPLFWAVLWTVKISLLLLWRRLLAGTGQWKFWWFVMVFTVLSFVGCLVTQFRSCDTIHNFTTLGLCITPHEQRVQNISLNYSFAADVVTEILVMIIPLRLLPKLRKARGDKIRLACLFSVGVLTILVSVFRVYFIQAKTGSKSPSPPWLGFWAIIECITAIIAGCIPTLSQLFRRSANNSSSNGTPQYHFQQPNPRHRSRDPEDSLASVADGYGGSSGLSGSGSALGDELVVHKHTTFQLSTVQRSGSHDSGMNIPDLEGRGLPLPPEFARTRPPTR